MEVYGSMLDSLITVGKNFKSLGTSDFSSITSDLKTLDYSFNQLKDTVEEIKNVSNKNRIYWSYENKDVKTTIKR